MTNSDFYPPSNLSHLVRRVAVFQESSIHRNWTGNDESARNQHEVVSLNEGPLRLRLSWRKSSRDTVTFIGVFDLELRNLLDEHYVRVELGVPDSVHLRFYHNPDDDIIYLQKNLQGPALPVGKVP